MEVKASAILGTTHSGLGVIKVNFTQFLDNLSAGIGASRQPFGKPSTRDNRHVKVVTGRTVAKTGRT